MSTQIILQQVFKKSAKYICTIWVIHDSSQWMYW